MKRTTYTPWPDGRDDACQHCYQSPPFHHAGGVCWNVKEMEAFLKAAMAQRDRERREEETP